MTITEKDNHIVVTADSGNYVGLADESVFGESLSLGVNTTLEDCIEKSMNEWPFYEEETE